MNSDQELIVKTTNLTKKYNKTAVVNAVNLSIPRGKIYGLLGKNGAGKTTTMCMLLNLVKKTSGEIAIFGKNTEKDSEIIFPKIGSIIETPGFYGDLTGKENLNLFSKLYHVDNNFIEQSLDMVSLAEQKDKLFKNYSLGMKQRLGIALALLKEPDLLILDEPINGLDPIGIQEIRNLLRNLADQYNITILISSHILSEIEHIADTIGIMDEGVLIEEISMDSLQEVIDHYVVFEVSKIDLACDILNKMGFYLNSDFTVSNNSIFLYNNFDKRSQINNHFVKAGIEVKTIKMVNQSLEEYFTNLIATR